MEQLKSWNSRKIISRLKSMQHDMLFITNCYRCNQFSHSTTGFFEPYNFVSNVTTIIQNPSFSEVSFELCKAVDTENKSNFKKLYSVKIWTVWHWSSRLAKILYSNKRMKHVPLLVLLWQIIPDELRLLSRYFYF